jgi:hypothetical protein
MTVTRFQPRHWRDRAKETRVKAAAASDNDTKHLLLHIAGAYDALADQAENETEPDRPP